MAPSNFIGTPSDDPFRPHRGNAVFHVTEGTSELSLRGHSPFIRALLAFELLARAQLCSAGSGLRSEAQGRRESEALWVLRGAE